MDYSIKMEEKKSLRLWDFSRVWCFHWESFTEFREHRIRSLNMSLFLFHLLLCVVCMEFTSFTLHGPQKSQFWRWTSFYYSACQLHSFTWKIYKLCIYLYIFVKIFKATTLITTINVSSIFFIFLLQVSVFNSWIFILR